MAWINKESEVNLGGEAQWSLQKEQSMMCLEELKKLTYIVRNLKVYDKDCFLMSIPQIEQIYKIMRYGLREHFPSKVISIEIKINEAKLLFTKHINNFLYLDKIPQTNGVEVYIDKIDELESELWDVWNEAGFGLRMKGKESKEDLVDRRLGALKEG